MFHLYSVSFIQVFVMEKSFFRITSVDELLRPVFLFIILRVHIVTLDE